MFKKCKRCLELKDKSEFRIRKKYKDGLYSYCKECEKIISNEYREKHGSIHYSDYKKYVERNALAVYNYLCNHSCEKCGESDPIVLDFHHYNNDKKYSISKMIINCKSLDSILEEINKCSVLCSNCHRREHAKKDNYMRYKIKNLLSDI